MNRIKIIISILCLTMATVVFSCKEDEHIGCECLPYTYKIKLLKNSSDNISDEDIYIIFRGERYNIATTKPEEPFLEKPITCLRGTMERIISPNRWRTPKSILEKQTFCIR